MAEVGASSFRDYLSLAHSNPAENVSLLNAVLINVTEFFRDPQAWQCLREDGLPLALRELQPGDPLRSGVWVVLGRRTLLAGDPAHRISGHVPVDYNIKIYATDIDEEALSIARRGEYPLERLRRVPAPLREKYFSGRGSILRVNRDIRRLTIFGRSNMVKRCADFSLQSCGLPQCLNIF